MHMKISHENYNVSTRLNEQRRRGAAFAVVNGHIARRLAARCQGPRARSSKIIYASSSACGRTRIYESEGEGRFELSGQVEGRPLLLSEIVQR